MRCTWFVLTAAAVSVTFAQTAVEYGITAGKTAAVAAGIGVAAKGTVDTALRQTNEALEKARRSQGKRAAATAAQDLSPLPRATARAKSRPASRGRGAARSGGSETSVAEAEMRAALARPRDPEPAAPTVIDPQAVRAGMTREELDALGRPSMAISGVDGEVRVYRTTDGSVSVKVKDGKVDSVR